LVCLTAEIR
jgi:catechol 2,3-dioxygenase-like lactoylglutathione lyase family enzyme